MRAIARGLLAASLLFAPATALADDAQAWLTARLSVKATKRLTLTTEVIRRTSRLRGFYDLSQMVQVSRRLTPHLSLTLGYTHQAVMTRGRLLASEHRVTQQIGFTNVARLGPLRIGGRLTLEERRRENVRGTALRLRPQVRATAALVGKVTLAVAEEVYFDLDRTPFQRIDQFERIRSQISLAAPLSQHLTAELGYVEQHGLIPNAPDTNDQIATFALTASF